MNAKTLAIPVLLALVLVAPSCMKVDATEDGKTEKRLAAIEQKLDRLAARLEEAPRSGVGREGMAHLKQRFRRIDDELETILTSIEFLAIDVDAIKRYSWDTLHAIQSTEGPEEPDAPAAYKRLFSPETRDALTAAAAKLGIALSEKHVTVPGVIIQRRAPLEFFAVSAGGKEHEAVVALTGSGENQPKAGSRMVEGLAGMLNACILALGYEKGTPVRASRDGKVLPPQGEPIHLYLEWTAEDGEMVRARAEDLVFNLDTNKPMARGKWVYVGSRFERDYSTGEVVYMADLTGDVVATYSWPNTIIDNTTSEGADDIYYTCLTPRIPKMGTKVMMVFSREPMEAKEFPALEDLEPEDREGK